MGNSTTKEIAMDQHSVKKEGKTDSEFAENTHQTNSANINLKNDQLGHVGTLGGDSSMSQQNKYAIPAKERNPNLAAQKEDSKEGSGMQLEEDFVKNQGCARMSYTDFLTELNRQTSAQPYQERTGHQNAHFLNQHIDKNSSVLDYRSDYLSGPGHRLQNDNAGITSFINKSRNFQEHIGTARYSLNNQSVAYSQNAHSMGFNQTNRPPESERAPFSPIGFDPEAIIHFIKCFEASENGVMVDRYVISDTEFLKFSKLISDKSDCELIRQDGVEGLLINFEKLKNIQAKFIGAFGRQKALLGALVANRIIDQNSRDAFGKYFGENGSGLYLVPLTIEPGRLLLLLVLFSKNENDFDRVSEKRSYSRLLRYLTQLCSENICAIDSADAALINFDFGSGIARHSRYTPQASRVENDQCELIWEACFSVDNSNKRVTGAGSSCGLLTRDFQPAQREVKNREYGVANMSSFATFFEGKSVKLKGLEQYFFRDVELFLEEFYLVELKKIQEEIKEKLKEIEVEKQDEIRQHIEEKVKLQKKYYTMRVLEKYWPVEWKALKSNFPKMDNQFRKFWEDAMDVKMVMASITDVSFQNLHKDFSDKILLETDKIIFRKFMEDRKIKKEDIEKVLRVKSKSKKKVNGEKEGQELTVKRGELECSRMTDEENRKSTEKSEIDMHGVDSEILEAENIVESEVQKSHNLRKKMKNHNKRPNINQVEKTESSNYDINSESERIEENKKSKFSVLCEIAQIIREKDRNFSSDYILKNLPSEILRIKSPKEFFDTHFKAILSDAEFLCLKIFEKIDSFFSFEGLRNSTKTEFLKERYFNLRKTEYFELLKRNLETDKQKPLVHITKIIVKNDSKWSIYKRSFSISWEEEGHTEPYNMYSISKLEISAAEIQESKSTEMFMFRPKEKPLFKFTEREKEQLVQVILLKNGKIGVLINQEQKSKLKFFNTQKTGVPEINSTPFGNTITLSDFNESQKRLALFSNKPGEIKLVVYFISDDCYLKTEATIELEGRFGISDVKCLRLGISNDIFLQDENNSVWKIDYKSQTGKKLGLFLEDLENLLVVPGTECLLLVNKFKIVPFVVESDLILPEIKIPFEFVPRELTIAKFDSQFQLIFTTKGEIRSYILKCVLSTQSYSLVSRNTRSTTDKTEKLKNRCILDYFSYMYEKFSVYNPLESVDQQAISQKLFLYFSDLENRNEETENKILRKLSEIESGIKKPHANRIGLAQNAEFWYSGDENSVRLFRFSGPKGLDKWLQEVICFVPIQIARSENNQFMILNSGKPLRIEETNNAFELQKKIDFGLYETILTNWKKDIKVITSMGKQSTGKSYTLNHLAGATFAISAGRCTDGCWFSMKITDDCLYVLMDFEGLGSFERSEQEDMLLAIQNAAMSSITLFKTEFAISKEIDQMFNRFNQGATLLKGSDGIFQGVFCILIKDARDTDVAGLTEEFTEKMDIIIKREDKKDFITTMYKNGFDVWAFPSLDLSQYYQEMEKLKTYIQQDIQPVFKNGKEFLNMLKTVMAKIAIQDFTSLNRQEIDMRIHVLTASYENALCWGSMADFKTTKKDYVLKSLDDGEREVGADIVIDLDEGGETVRIIYEDPELDLRQDNKGFVELLNRFFLKSHSNHASWSRMFRIFVRAAIARRVERVVRWVNMNLEKWESVSEFQVVVSAFKQLISHRTKEIQARFQVCLSKCDSCHASCVLCSSHSESHSCDLVEHRCSHNCGYCELESETRKCALDFGHYEKHTCSLKSHTCGLACRYPHCKGTCNEKGKHTGDHQCALLIHECGAACSLEKCGNRCQISADKEHTVHKCVNEQCAKLCEVQRCQIRCRCSDHFHGNHDLSQRFKLENNMDLSKADYQDGEGNGVNLNFHCCGNEHQCSLECSQDGFCRVIVERKVVKEEFRGERDQFSFSKQFENIGEKLPCNKMIEPLRKDHAGSHTHTDELTNCHTCTTRCPTCNNICEKQVGHEGKHSTTHGNMEKCYFISDQNDVNVGDHKYVVGESSMAEMCNMFCNTLGRGHIHVVKCGDNKDECRNQEEGKRRHQSCSYGPDPELTKDEVMHDVYWDLIDFEDPCQRVDRDNFSKCPYFCGSTDHHKEAGKRYCQLPLWHEKVKSLSEVGTSQGIVSKDGHYFECTHSVDSEGFHFYLCLDDSGSMSGQNWTDLVCAVTDFCTSRATSVCDKLTIVQFTDKPKVMCENIQFSQFDSNTCLRFRGGGTHFGNAIRTSHQLITQHLTPGTKPVFIFMSDGENQTGDEEMEQLYHDLNLSELSVYTIAFGGSIEKLKLLAKMAKGQYLSSIGGLQLKSNFMEISSAFGTTVGVMPSMK